MIPALPSVEEEVLSRKKAAEIAEALDGNRIPEELKDIPPSLLSAEHIHSFVTSTGLISPFHIGGKKPRLKKASYEGRIGDTAYIFHNHKLKPATFVDRKLLVPANSIVFVESDIDFRLPNYIAVRFNLHIEHVHRGLLLGTGPLVDPGFWGKLCIPLHNLTSEDYEISKDDGLIWLEFTRTTFNLADTEAGIGAKPSNSGYWDIHKFITKAAKGTGGTTNVPIQSSIGDALKRASDAAVSAQRQTRIYSIASLVGALVLIVSAVTFSQGMISTISSQADISKQYIDDARAESKRYYSQYEDQEILVRRQGEQLESAAAQISEILNRQVDVEELSAQVDQLSSAVKALQARVESYVPIPPPQ